jgi:hypothetical protein
MCDNGVVEVSKGTYKNMDFANVRSPVARFSEKPEEPSFGRGEVKSLEYRIKLIKDITVFGRQFRAGIVGTTDMVWRFSDYCSYRGEDFVKMKVGGYSFEVPAEAFRVFDPSSGKWLETYNGDKAFKPVAEERIAHV